MMEVSSFQAHALKIVNYSSQSLRKLTLETQLSCCNEAHAAPRGRLQEEELSPQASSSG